MQRAALRREFPDASESGAEGFCIAPRRSSRRKIFCLRGCTGTARAAKCRKFNGAISRESCGLADRTSMLSIWKWRRKAVRRRFTLESSRL